MDKRDCCTYTASSFDPTPLPPTSSMDCKTGEIVVEEAEFVKGVHSSLNGTHLDRFLAVVPRAPVLRNLPCAIEIEDFTCMLVSLSIPQIGVPSVTTSYGGGSVKLSSFTRTAYDPVTITFKVDACWRSYTLIERWLHAMSGDGGQVQECGDYHTNLIVYALDGNCDPKAKWTLGGAFPTNLGGISFTYADDGASTVTAQATFEFSLLDFAPVCE